MTDLEIPRGTSWGTRWPVTDSEGADLDVTAWSVQAQVRPEALSDDVLHEWSTTIGNAETGDGYIELIVDHGESTAWTWTTGVYDVMLTSPEDQRTRVDYGRVEVLETVTREDT